VRKLRRVALTGVPGPVVLAVPVDVGLERVVGGQTLVVRHARSTPPPRRPAAAAVERAARLLLAAKRPLIVGGIRAVRARAAAPLRRLAERLNCQVVTSGPAKALFPEAAFHRLGLGVLGLGGRAEADRAAAAADVLLLVGEPFGDLTSDNFSPRYRRKRLIQLDAEAAQIGRNMPVEVGIHGDPRLSLEALLAAVDRLAPRPRAVAIDFAPARPLPSVGQILARTRPGLRPTTVTVMRLLGQLIPQWAQVLGDIGTAGMLHTLHDLPRARDNRYQLAQGQGALGSAIAGALGAALASRDPVVTLAGDAAFEQQMGAELRTALEAKVRYLLVVLSDSGNGMVQAGFRQLRGKYPNAMYPRAAPVARIARLLGAAAFEVRTARGLARVFPRAMAARKVAVIEVHLRPGGGGLVARRSGQFED
jgi:acetolactate synthase-1/2/3 large subunit